MQATVATFEPDGSGTVVSDQGRIIDFSAAAFARGGLRLLRPGQRVRLRLSSQGEVETITILTLPDPD